MCSAHMLEAGHHSQAGSDRHELKGILVDVLTLYASACIYSRVMQKQEYTQMRVADL